MIADTAVIMIGIDITAKNAATMIVINITAKDTATMIVRDQILMIDLRLAQ
jgi:hypothetical protein